MRQALCFFCLGRVTCLELMFLLLKGSCFRTLVEKFKVKRFVHVCLNKLNMRRFVPSMLFLAKTMALGKFQSKT